MLYIIAIIFPPLALLLVGRPFSAVVNCFLTLLFWVPGILHAMFAVSDHKNKQNMRQLLRRQFS